jgi:hypothetical protein
MKYEERNEPWGTFDDIYLLVRDFLAAIGAVSVMAFVIGYLWGWL